MSCFNVLETMVLKGRTR